MPLQHWNLLSSWPDLFVFVKNHDLSSRLCLLSVFCFVSAFRSVITAGSHDVFGSAFTSVITVSCYLSKY